MAGRKRRKLILFLSLNAGVLFCLLIGLGLFFRTIRDTLPPTPIGDQKIVGYAQYFGYPLSLDAILFFVFISVPVVVGLVARNDKKNS